MMNGENFQKMTSVPLGTKSRAKFAGPLWETAQLYIICASCFKWTSPPQRICNKGHQICSSCLDDCCPVLNCSNERCIQTLVTAPVGIYHHLYNTTVMPCPFKEKGCEVNLLGSDMEKHLAHECKIRSLQKCLLSACEAKHIEYDKYETHLRRIHEIPHVNKSTMTILVVFGNEKLTTSDDANVKCILTLESCGVKFAVFFGECADRAVFWVAALDEIMTGHKYRAKINLSAACRLHRLEDCRMDIHEVEFPVKSMYSCNMIEMDENEECLGIDKSTLGSNYLDPNDFGQKLCRVEVAIQDSN